jgi:hypothetical protein
MGAKVGRFFEIYIWGMRGGLKGGFGVGFGIVAKIQHMALSAIIILKFFS